MTKNELLRTAYSSLTSLDAPNGENENRLVRRILYALVEGGEGIADPMSTNEAWRRIVGAYEGSEIAESGLTDNACMVRTLIALGTTPTHGMTEHHLLSLISESIAPSDPTALNWTRSDVTWEDETITWETTNTP